MCGRRCDGPSARRARRTLRPNRRPGPSPVAQAEFILAAGEPDPGQQREAIGRMLEAGAAGLERLVGDSGDSGADLTLEEAGGLECVLLLYGRPAILVSGGNLAACPPSGTCSKTSAKMWRWPSAASAASNCSATPSTTGPARVSWSTKTS